MNLLDQGNLWLMLDRAEAGPVSAAVCDVSSDQFVGVTAPRADFRGALYQFLIGLLQTAYAPKDHDEWFARWKTPPSRDELAKAFSPFAAAFELDGDGPAFMQDYEVLPEKNINSTDSLLIDLGSESNIYFNKLRAWDGMCPACFATAIFTLQINAPAGGRGYQTSVRGGGPLTTLILPAKQDATLWEKLWLNVLPSNHFLDSDCDSVVFKESLNFPWLCSTIVGGKAGIPIVPSPENKLLPYWGTPRRVSAELKNRRAGECEICSAHSNELIEKYRFLSGGADYKGPWTHPLSPYVLDSKTREVLSFKGGRAYGGYKNWASFTLGDEDAGVCVAQVIADFNSRKFRYFPAKERAVVVWCFGYDMQPGQAKALCWYDTVLPLYVHDSEKIKKKMDSSTRLLLEVASESARLLGKYVKAARFSRPADVGNEPAVPQSFWQGTEALFYQSLQTMANAEALDENTVAAIYRAWLIKLRGKTIALFDDWVLSAPIEDMDMKRVVQARTELGKWLNAAKPMKSMWQIVKDVEALQKEGA
ncbi:type I-E CRISPR-associated protein Cse1/CasA [Jeongeupia sp. HS-3]|uniref:type I-E CRISPR-associated protein Cse1/CasA n=1 Tax=Jeongeupia sp. HS-3 TaxID=1009682 RepID=UPI0018A34496|nr:type I-E CRISPR-associated protein Cse1/CasA [Jeongeupia sp. HS-3]BCL75811.1 type I-E CRISPR-associated protein Cse1/CasA [Jeongeupia sp. HS-3]